MRKKIKCLEKDKIEVSVDSEDEIIEIIKKNKNELLEGINAEKIEFTQQKEMEEYQIDGRIVKISIIKKQLERKR